MQLTTDGKGRIIRNGENERLPSDQSSRQASPQKVPSVSQRIDRLLQAYVEFTSSAGNQDKVLKLVQYSLFLLSQFYSKPLRGTIRKLSDELLWARYVNRFFGLPTSIEGARSGAWASSKRLGKAMAWTMIAYYPLEHIAYLKWKAPDVMCIIPCRSESRLAARASAWSCRYWLAYMMLDVARSCSALSSGGEAVPSEDEKKVSRKERLQIVRNALFFLPALTWSLPKWDTDPLLSSLACNGLMWLESVVCMYQAVSI